MKSIVVAVRDVQSNGFIKPQYFVTLEASMRAFEVAVTGGDPSMSEFPDDYSLYYLGTYDDETGMHESDGPPKRVYTGFEALSSAKRRRQKLEALNAEIALLNGDGDAN